MSSENRKPVDLDAAAALTDLEALWKRVDRPGVRTIGTSFIEERIAKAVKLLRFITTTESPSPQATPSEARGPSPSPSLDKLREAAAHIEVLADAIGTGNRM